MEEIYFVHQDQAFPGMPRLSFYVLQAGGGIGLGEGTARFETPRTRKHLGRGAASDRSSKCASREGCERMILISRANVPSRPGKTLRSACKNSPLTTHLAIVTEGKMY